MKKFVTALATTLCIVCSAQAAPVVLTGTQNQTIAGQDFVFNFSSLAPASGAGTFVIRARGDFQDTSGFAGGETLSWSLDGRINGGPVGGFVGSTGVGGPFDSFTQYVLDRNVEFQRTYTLTAGEVASLLADAALNISVDFAADVGAIETIRFIEVTFTYDNGIVSEVPEPGSLALLGLGLVGLAASRKRKQG